MIAGNNESKQSIPASKNTEKTVFSLLRRKPREREKYTKAIKGELDALGATGPSIRQQLDKARIRELAFKHIFRISFSIFSAALLVWQNYEVFSIIDRAFLGHQLKDLQLIFSSLIGATLTETYFILRIIVSFVFSFNDYKYENQS